MLHVWKTLCLFVYEFLRNKKGLVLFSLSWPVSVTFWETLTQRTMFLIRNSPVSFVFIWCFYRFLWCVSISLKLNYLVQFCWEFLVSLILTLLFISLSLSLYIYIYIYPGSKWKKSNSSGTLWPLSCLVLLVLWYLSSLYG